MAPLLKGSARLHQSPRSRSDAQVVARVTPLCGEEAAAARNINNRRSARLRRARTAGAACGVGKVQDPAPRQLGRTSLKSNQRIWVPMAKAARTGSSWNDVPGTLAPFGTMVPGTTGAMSAAQAGLTLSPSRPHPMVSEKRFRQRERGQRAAWPSTSSWRRTDETKPGGS